MLVRRAEAKTSADWKRLLLADGPRQSINALILYSFVYANGFQTSNIPAYWDDSAITAMLLFSMIATVLIFAGSLVLLVAAAVLYMPLLCYIQGNLKVRHNIRLSSETHLGVGICLSQGRQGERRR